MELTSEFYALVMEHTVIYSVSSCTNPTPLFQTVTSSHIYLQFVIRGMPPGLGKKQQILKTNVSFQTWSGLQQLMGLMGG